MTIVYLLTGSNIGDSLTHLRQAAVYIDKQVGSVVSKSSVYQTEPWGNKNQQDFLNQVLELQTEMEAEQVLQIILQIEQEMGRNRKQKWEARIIDIDILFYGHQIIQTENLTVPHPLLQERRFTLMPLNEIAPAYVHPVLQQTVSELLSQCPDNSVVNRF
jgi:2-amino-4-hydroxy-6-hydroxymethyldihydropteridine diphosphokinase